MKLGIETASLVNAISTGPKQPEPKVGDGATVCSWTDRYGCTIIEASDTRVVVQEDYAKRTDTNGMSDCQHYSYTPNTNGRCWTFTKRKDGRWREYRSVKDSSAGLRIGVRDKHHDFSF